MSGEVIATTEYHLVGMFLSGVAHGRATWTGESVARSRLSD